MFRGKKALSIKFEFSEEYRRLYFVQLNLTRLIIYLVDSRMRKMKLVAKKSVFNSTPDTLGHTTHSYTLGF